MCGRHWQELRRLPARWHDCLHLRRACERVPQRVVNPLRQEAHGDVVPLGNQRGELESRQVQEEHVHRGAQRIADGALAEAVLPDEGLGQCRPVVADLEPFEELQRWRSGYRARVR